MLFRSWPGIIGKFGTDAVLNVAAMATFQAVARSIATEIKSLKPVSSIAMSELGIVQKVLDAGGGAEAGRIDLIPATGVKIAAKRVEVESQNAVEIKAQTGMELLAPEIVLSSDATKQKAHVWVSGGSGNVEIAGTSGAGGVGKLSLDSGAATLSADKIVVGRVIPTPDPVPGILRSQLIAAEAAVTEAEDAFNPLWDQYVHAETELSKATAWLACKAAAKVVYAAIETRDAINQKLASHLPPASDDLLAGLSVDNTKTALTHAATSLEVTTQGVAMSFGAAKFELNAQGLSGSGLLIKLG